ncbi:hypothetical protein Vretimale_4446 [Volvox reticuliferus]|uniref:Fe2OG dioxygenase domain-containing protein n=1 Tax=Volvox reticuliferus TaxID=1737510 RepID=A0A8J4DAZ1_9CHLO|nr:hypothetical protein Vretifemale_3029 [Volvox reticuliferus]GIL99216.1 hypothetical protein Vretimale_4446 [Volvox reticuliferus]
MEHIFYRLFCPGGFRARLSMGRGSDKAFAAYERWINNYRVASLWIAQKHVERAVDANGGLVRLENFLPEFVAEGILSTVGAVSDEQWNDTSANTDYRQNNISHSFSSVKHAKGLDAVVRLFSLVRPGSLNSFSAAKYCKTDHIAPHDDRAYAQVKLDSGRIITASRTLAVIFYLTRDWREEYGGVLIDLEDPTAPPGVGRKYVPLWNSVVAFRVPRYHAVTPMTTNRPRYSIFGWFLEPGRLYELYRGEDAESGKEADRQGAGQHKRHAGAKRKSGGLGTADDAETAPGPGAAGRGVETAVTGEADTLQLGSGAQHEMSQKLSRTNATQHGPRVKRQRNADMDRTEVEPSWRRSAKQRQSRGHRQNSAWQHQQQEEDIMGQERRPSNAIQGAVGGTVKGRGGLGSETALGRVRAARLPGRWQGRRKHMCVQ